MNFFLHCHSCHYCHNCHNLRFEVCHHLFFWVLSQFQFLSLVTIRFFFSFVTIWVFEFGHNLCFLVSSQFEVFSFVTIWVFEFCPNLSFWVLSQFVFLCFVTIWVLKFCYNCHKCHYCHYWRIDRYVGRFKLPFDTQKVTFSQRLPTDQRTDGRTDRRTDGQLDF